MIFNYKFKDAELYIEREKDFESDEIINILKRIDEMGQVSMTNTAPDETINTLKCINEVGQVSTTNTVSNKETSRSQEVKPAEKKTDVRLPNTIATKYFSDFACPSCHQGVILKSEGVIYVRDVNGENKVYSLLRSSVEDNFKNIVDLMYKEGVRENFPSIVDEIDVKINNDELTDGHCLSCNTSHSLNEWAIAGSFADPSICPICGNFACYNPNKNKEVIIKCENLECHYEKKIRE